MSITKERRDAIPQEAIRDAARAMKDRDLIKGVDEYYERLASTAITAAVPHLALDATDREALSSMEEISRLRAELEAAEAKIVGPVVWKYFDPGIAPATWHPLDENGHAEMRVNGRRITTFASYPAAEEAAERVNAAVNAAPPAASLELAKSALQDYPIGRVLPLSTEGAVLAVEPVKVKPLEWAAVTDQIPKHAFAAYTAFSRWLIVCEFLSMNHMVYRFNSADYETLEAAKAAAQADYERRIRSALISPAPSS